MATKAMDRARFLGNLPLLDEVADYTLDLLAMLAKKSETEVDDGFVAFLKLAKADKAFRDWLAQLLHSGKAPRSLRGVAVPDAVVRALAQRKLSLGDVLKYLPLFLELILKFKK